VSKELFRSGKGSRTSRPSLEKERVIGRHGLFSCYEAFIHIVDSMFNQHAKWLKTTSPDVGSGLRGKKGTSCGEIDAC